MTPDGIGDVLDVGMGVAGLRPLERQRILLEADPARAFTAKGKVAETR